MASDVDCEILFLGKKRTVAGGLAAPANGTSYYPVLVQHRKYANKPSRPVLTTRNHSRIKENRRQIVHFALHLKTRDFISI